MDCEQLAPLYEEYALGVLEGEERAEIEAHLARACLHCAPGIEKARWVVAQLAQMAPEAQPPRSLKGKILDAVKSSGNVTEFAKAPPNRASLGLGCRRGTRNSDGIFDSPDGESNHAVGRTAPADENRHAAEQGAPGPA